MHLEILNREILHHQILTLEIIHSVESLRSCILIP